MQSLARFIVCIGAVVFQSACAQLETPGDWPHHNRDAGSSRYSPLTQINADNVSDLQLAWTYAPSNINASEEDKRNAAAWAKVLAELNLANPVGGIGFKVVPIVVSGVMYAPAGNGVVAIDAANGQELWRYALPQGTMASDHGVNYWPGSEYAAPRIVFTAGRNLIALDAATGRAVTEFGVGGAADMGVEWRGVPVVFGDVLAVGANVLETPQDPNAPGDTQGFDAMTGAKKWVFHSVPRPGEVGHETWLNDGWRDRSGTNVWSPHMTVDEELGLIYMPIGGPSSNYYGGDRPGNNLFGNSIVAIEGDTGKYRWHFQLVHHDIWDFDNPPAPVLITIRKDGKTIPAIVQVGKTGWMFILDRRTGEPVFGVEERPVAKGDVPGEWYAPTQPFPVKPGALAKMDFKPDDIVTAQDTTAAHAAACRALYEKSGGFYNAGPFTPFLLQQDGSPPRSTINFPGSAGGTNRGGMATDQQHGIVFAYTQNLGQIGWTIKKREGWVDTIEEQHSELPYTRASVEGNSPLSTFSAPAGKGLSNYPCHKPPWGQLHAVDANTGEILWQVRVGIAEDLPLEKQDTGLANGFAGPTATAGGLVFYAALHDGLLRAFDSTTGAEVWSDDLVYAAITQPISYLGSDGRQYIAISVAGSIRAYALSK